MKVEVELVVGVDEVDDDTGGIWEDGGAANRSNRRSGIS